MFDDDQPSNSTSESDHNGGGGKRARTAPASKNLAKQRLKKEKKRKERPFPRAYVRSMLTKLVDDYEGNLDCLADDLGTTKKGLEYALTELSWTAHRLTEAAIRNLFEQRFTATADPFPEFLRLAREEVLIAKATPGVPTLRNVLVKYDGFLSHFDSKDVFDYVCAQSVHVLVQFSKAFHCKGCFDRKTACETGIKIAEAAINMSRQHIKDQANQSIADIFELQILRLEVNIIAFHVESMKATTRSDLVKLLLPLDPISKIRDLSNKPQFCHLWQAPYNGIETSMILDRFEDAKSFYDKLVKLDPGFRDFSYESGEVPPMGADHSPADIKEFCRRISTEFKSEGECQ